MEVEARAAKFVADGVGAVVQDNVVDVDALVAITPDDEVRAAAGREGVLDLLPRTW